MDANFSLNSFVSDECYDLRFYDTVGRDLAYEIESIDHARNSLVVWVRVAELNASTSIFAFWGNENLSDRAPVHAIDGSTWSEGFRGVWHLFPMEITDILVDSSPYRNHAINVGGITAPLGKFGTGRNLFGGGDQFIKIPRASSLNSLGRDNYSFSTWVTLENQPDTEIIDSFYALGYEQVPNDRFFNDINQLIDLRPSGARIFKEGPRQGLYLNGAADFQNANIGINRSNNYMTLFMSMFHPPEDGPYRFRCTDKDDRATIWLDLDRDGNFELNGDLGSEMIGGINNFTSGNYILDASGGPYKIAIAHGQWGGGTRLRPWIMIPSDENWHVIDPVDPVQSGFWRIPFDSSVSDDLTAYNFYSHGVSSALNVQNGKFGLFHPLRSGYLSSASSLTLLNDQWYHLHKQIDTVSGTAQLFINGVESVSTGFDPSLGVEKTIDSDWIVGAGTISSTIDEIRISSINRSDDWIVASYQNQKENPAFPSFSSPLEGPPSFTSENNFRIFAEEKFTHIAKATGSPTAYVATGLPSGLLLDPSDGNLSGFPTTSGLYEPKIRAIYDNAQIAIQSYRIEVLTNPPEITLAVPQPAGASFLEIPFNIDATGGEDPRVWVLADTTDHGKEFFKWKYRFDLGERSLGPNSAIVGELEPDKFYYIRLYAYNSAGEDWTGKEFFTRTQPAKSNLPNTLAMWFDAADISGTGDAADPGMEVSTWVDKSGYSRNMDIRVGDPSVAFDGVGGMPVVDFDGNDQLISTYDFAADDLTVWRKGGYTAFGVSRYTGGRNNRVISSRGQNWFMGHHGNRNGRFYMNGWVNTGYSSDTSFHIWTILQEGRDHSGDPTSIVYGDAVELANNQRSNNWWFHPGQISFGAWGDLSEASKCQVAEFIIFKGLVFDEDRLIIEGYLGQKWGIDLPTNHPWANEKPTFGEDIVLGSTAVALTVQTELPVVRNREPADSKNDSAVLAGQLVDAGLGMVPSDTGNNKFTPKDYSGLRLWLDVSDADGDGIPGSEYDDVNVSAPSPWNPSFLSPAYWLDASDLTSAGSTWTNKGTYTTNATRHGSPNVIQNVQNGLSVMRYSGANGEYHSFANLTNIRTVFWVYKQNAPGSYFMLGDNNQYHFHKGNKMFDSGWSSPNVQSGYLRLNGHEAVVNEADFPASLSIMALRTSGNVEASNFSNDRNIGGRYARGDLGELIIFTTALSDKEIEKVEGYLAHKWALDGRTS